MRQVKTKYPLKYAPNLSPAADTLSTASGGTLHKSQQSNWTISSIQLLKSAYNSAATMPHSF